jgi:hypothetical protein
MDDHDVRGSRWRVDRVGVRAVACRGGGERGVAEQGSGRLGRRVCGSPAGSLRAVFLPRASGYSPTSTSRSASGLSSTPSSVVTCLPRSGRCWGCGDAGGVRRVGRGVLAVRGPADRRGSAAVPAGWVGPGCAVAPYRVVRRIEETADVISLVLEPVDSKPLPEIAAGQHVSVFVGLPDGRRPPRQYTVTSTASGTRLQITVRRLRGVGGVPDGMVSSCLHDNAMPGVILELSAPAGSFVVLPAQTPLLLASPGGGITTVLPIVEQVARNDQTDDFTAHLVRDRRAGGQPCPPGTRISPRSPFQTTSECSPVDRCHPCGWSAPPWSTAAYHPIESATRCADQASGPPKSPPERHRQHSGVVTTADIGSTRDIKIDGANIRRIDALVRAGLAE